MAKPDQSLLDRRAGIDQAMGDLPLAEGTSSTARSLGGVPVHDVTPPSGEDAPVVMYFHGGGFRMGSALAWRAYGSHLARHAGARVVVVDYRLAPEHPYPAAVDDLVASYAALLEEGTAPGTVVFAGDSAGGNLAAAGILAARQRGHALPAGAVCCSPWVDLTNSAATYETKRSVDQLFSLESATEATEAYLDGSTDPRDPIVSPVFGDWAGGPPVLIQVGEHEVLLDDAARLADVMRQAGVDVRHHVYPEMPHVWQLGYPSLPQAVDAVEEIAGFVREVTAGG